MKTLPKYITVFRAGFRVRIVRGEMTYQAVTPDLSRAIALRDKFLAIAEPMRATLKPRSNTGHLGISETVSWRHCRRYPNFLVCHAGRSQRVYFNEMSRDAALKIAINVRKQMEAAYV